MYTFNTINIYFLYFIYFLYIYFNFKEIPENGADVYHLQQVHSAFVTSGTDLRYTNLYHGKFLKHIWGGSWEAADNKAEKHLGILSLTHHATLFGYRVPKSDFNVTAKQVWISMHTTT